MSDEIEFGKYKTKGAYHWRIYFGSVFQIDSFLRGRYHVVLHLLKRAGITSSSSVLEVGCGDGALSGLTYKNFRCHLTGVDPSPDGITICRKMFEKYGFKGSFAVAGGYQFPFADNHFDLIVLADVIEHVQQPELMLKEIKRLLKDGGHLVITTPVRTSEQPEDKMHVREFYPEELIELCKVDFGEPLERVYSHPVVWYELYSHGKRLNRSIIRAYCRVMDKLLKANPFFNPRVKVRWNNFKQQGLLLRSTTGFEASGK